MAELPGIPTLVELGRTMEENQVLGIFASAGTIGRSFLTMPRVPPDRVDALRQAFDAMLKDADFLARSRNVSPAVLERARAAAKR